MAVYARHLRIVVLGLIVVVGGLMALPSGSGLDMAAEAQERKRSLNFFGTLFKKTQRPQRAIRKRLKPSAKPWWQRSTRKAIRVRPAKRNSNTTKRRTTTRRTAVQGTAVASRPESSAVAKEADARVILVVGDFLAAGLARGLKQAYAENPTMTVENRGMSSSGLVRYDHYDWQAEAARFLAEQPRVDVVVVLAGANDSQPFRGEGRAFAFKTEAWVQAYRQRAANLMKLINEAGKPVVWLSVPPMQKQSLSTNIAFMNDIQKQAADDAAGVTYVDIWNGFADENGRYISNGPDEKGQVRRLRTGDGINLSAAGRGKIAFFAQQAIDQVAGGTVSTFAALNTGPEAGPIESAAPVRPDVWDMVLTGPAKSSAPLTLAGAKPDVPDLVPRQETDTDAALVLKRLRDGLPPDARPGRIDAINAGAPAAQPAL